MTVEDVDVSTPQDRRRTPLRLVKGSLRWLIPTVLAAVIGTQIGVYSARPRIGVQITGFTLDITQAAPGEAQRQVTSDARLVALTVQNNWLPQLKSELSLQEYVDNLKAVSEVGRQAADSIARLRTDLSEWPSGRAPIDAARAAFDFLDRHGNTVRAHLFPEVNRLGSSLLVDVNADRQPFIAFSEDEDGDYRLRQGARVVPFFWTTRVRSGQHREELQRTAHRATLAVAHGDPAGLAALREEINKILADEAGAREAADRAEQELRRLSNWIVRATITNSGGQPVSVAPRAALYLNVEGLTVDLENEKFVFKDPIRLPLEATRYVTPTKGAADAAAGQSDDREVLTVSSEPIVVRPGEAVAVTFRTASRIRELQDGGALLRVFTDHRAQTRLSILSITDRAAAAGPVTRLSGLGVFAELSFEEAFPQAITWK